MGKNALSPDDNKWLEYTLRELKNSRNDLKSQLFCFGGMDKKNLSLIKSVENIIKYGFVESEMIRLVINEIKSGKKDLNDLGFVTSGGNTFDSAAILEGMKHYDNAKFALKSLINSRRFDLNLEGNNEENHNIYSHFNLKTGEHILAPKERVAIENTIKEITMATEDFRDIINSGQIASLKNKLVGTLDKGKISNFDMKEILIRLDDMKELYKRYGEFICSNKEEISAMVRAINHYENAHKIMAGIAKEDIAKAHNHESMIKRLFGRKNDNRNKLTECQNKHKAKDISQSMSLF